MKIIYIFNDSFNQGADLLNSGFIYLKKQNKLMILGGSHSDSILNFDLNNFNKNFSNDIDNEYKWIKLLNCKMPSSKWSKFCYDITKDEHYLIIILMDLKMI